jgi:hypothetical protein
MFGHHGRPNVHLFSLMGTFFFGPPLPDMGAVFAGGNTFSLMGTGFADGRNASVFFYPNSSVRYLHSEFFRVGLVPD